MDKSVYFTDQFFSFGRKDIFNESQEKVGVLDLRSALSSSLSVENGNGEVVVDGSFPFFSNKWVIKKPDNTELGKVSEGFSFFTKRYRYKKGEQIYEIESPAFSKEYTILNVREETVATFKKVSGIFQAAAYELKNVSEHLLTEELIAVVMGVNEMEKRRRSSANTPG